MLQVDSRQTEGERENANYLAAKKRRKIKQKVASKPTDLDGAGRVVSNGA
jgi:hypothetical protein